MSEAREIILCPICCKEIHRHFASPIVSHGRVSSRAHPSEQAVLLTQMMLAAEDMHQQIIQTAEDACVEHMRSVHPRRYRLWLRLRWNWILQRRWPWSRLDHDQFEFGADR